MINDLLCYPMFLLTGIAIVWAIYTYRLLKDNGFRLTYTSITVTGEDIMKAARNKRLARPLLGAVFGPLQTKKKGKDYVHTIKSGDWNDPEIWSTGKVPGRGMMICIDDEITITRGVDPDLKNDILKWREQYDEKK